MPGLLGRAMHAFRSRRLPQCRACVAARIRLAPGRGGAQLSGAGFGDGPRRHHARRRGPPRGPGFLAMRDAMRGVARRRGVREAEIGWRTRHFARIAARHRRARHGGALPGAGEGLWRGGAAGVLVGAEQSPRIAAAPRRESNPAVVIWRGLHARVGRGRRGAIGPPRRGRPTTWPPRRQQRPAAHAPRSTRAAARPGPRRTCGERARCSTGAPLACRPMPAAPPRPGARTARLLLTAARTGRELPGAGGGAGAEPWKRLSAVGAGALTRCRALLAAAHAAGARGAGPEAPPGPGRARPGGCGVRHPPRGPLAWCAAAVPAGAAPPTAAAPSSPRL